MEITRKGKIRVTGTIRRVAAFSLPAYCNVRISDGVRRVSEFKSEPAEFSGDRGSCAVTVPFKWVIFDDSMLVSVTGYVSNRSDGLGSSFKADTPLIGRIRDIPFKDISLPPEGKVATLSFNIEM